MRQLSEKHGVERSGPRGMRTIFSVVPALVLLTAVGQVAAQEPPKPPPYSLPWQLRPVVASTVVRSDTSFALYEDAAVGEAWRR